MDPIPRLQRPAFVSPRAARLANNPLSNSVTSSRSNENDSSDSELEIISRDTFMSRRKSQHEPLRHLAAVHRGAAETSTAQRPSPHSEATTSANGNVPEIDSQQAMAGFRVRKNGERLTQSVPEFSNHAKAPSSSPTEFRAGSHSNMSTVDRIASVYTNRIASGEPLDQTGRKHKRVLTPQKKRPFSNVRLSSEDSKDDLPSTAQNSHTTNSQHQLSVPSQDSLGISLIPRPSSDGGQSLKRSYSNQSIASSSIEGIKRARVARTSPTRTPLRGSGDAISTQLSSRQSNRLQDAQIQEPQHSPYKPVPQPLSAVTSMEQLTIPNNTPALTPQPSLAQLLQQVANVPPTGQTIVLGSTSASRIGYTSRIEYNDLSMDDSDDSPPKGIPSAGRHASGFLSGPAPTPAPKVAGVLPASPRPPGSPLQTPTRPDVSTGPALAPESVYTISKGPLPAAPEIRPMPAARKGQQFTVEEDKFLIHLKEVEEYKWAAIEPFFPGRKWTSLQSRYSTSLQRGKPARPKDLSQGSPPTDAILRRGTLPAIYQRQQRAETDLETDSFSAAPKRLLRRAEHASLNVSDLIDKVTARNEYQPSYQTQLRAVFKGLRQDVPTFSCDRILRDRALGLSGGRAGPKQLHSAAKLYAYSTFGPHRFMDDASGDVSTVAWSPNGTIFAAGAVAVADGQNQQYNKPGNLVIGDAIHGNIKELPQHQVPRPRVEKGDNSKASMRKSQDAVVYHTVQMVAFAPDGENMYSVSRDHRLNMYEIREDVLDTEYLRSINHEGPVDLLAVSNMGYVATGCRVSGVQSIRVLGSEYNSIFMPITTTAARKYPSALKWGIASQHSQYLLAGMSCEVDRVYIEDDHRERDGETCLWDVNTGQKLEVQHSNRNVFDVAWNPYPSSASTIFAVACGSVGKLTNNTGIHSVVRLYAPNQGGASASRTAELDCPALDINDVVYSPHDNNIIAVGDTEGKVYLWDLRQIKKEQVPLRTFEHGETKSVMEIATGIRFLSWGEDRNRLYTGSSDGVVKCWDPYRSDEDTHVRDVATFHSGIMSGAFSPDYCSLLIGEDNSRLNLLTIGDEHKSTADMASFRVHKAQASEVQYPYDSAAKELVQSGQIEIRHAGALPIKQAVQGPNYNQSGLYRTDPEAPSMRDTAVAFQEKLYRMHKRNKKFQKSMRNLGHAPSACILDCAHKPTNLDDFGALEETGRSYDRIPDNLRNPQLLSKRDAQLQGLIAKCTGCDNPARPADADDKTVENAAKPLCERCRFACFRCSRPARVSGRRRVVECLACGLAWEAGVLGFDLIRDEKVVVKGKDKARNDVAVDGLVDAGVTGLEQEMDELEIAADVMKHYFDQGT